MAGASIPLKIRSAPAVFLVFVPNSGTLHSFTREVPSCIAGISSSGALPWLSAQFFYPHVTARDTVRRHKLQLMDIAATTLPVLISCLCPSLVSMRLWGTRTITTAIAFTGSMKGSGTTVVTGMAHGITRESAMSRAT